MRLLHFDRSERLVSTYFSGKSIPPYAILSHRWGDSEVLFEDLRNNTYKGKEGYRKIEFCAKRAALDQLQYFWIDTCCIDKWDLDELSKSINSMFSWYKNATKCYVFLTDVSITTTVEVAQESAWEASFRASTWFTRGWTLQELIAPVSIEFFSSERLRIGDKQSLERLLHEVTSIPIKALQNHPLDEFAISERIRWVKKRETTEPEDKVYCLLGILDLFMPTSYGEGEEKARRRLQIELNAASSAPFIIPFSQNDRFIGQESQLAKLEAGLFGGKQPATITIVGPGGTGKSQLALEFAHRTRQKQKNCSIFWIDASNMDSLSQSYASIARKLKIPDWDDEKADFKQLVNLYLGKRDASQSLLIFDNANDVNLRSIGLSKAQSANLTDYLPQSKQCSILFTTTSNVFAKRLASENVIKLGKLMPYTAQKMLENYLSAPMSKTEQSEAEILLQELLYLPLALVQAAAYINANNVTIQDYRSRLAKLKEGAPEHGSELSKEKQQESGTKSPVARTLFLSMDQIRRDNPLAADYLFLTACLDRRDISLALLESSSHHERENAIGILNSYALVTRRPAESAIDVHQLVHCALRGWLYNQATLDQWAQIAIARLLDVFPDDSDGNRSKWRRLLPHAMYTLSHNSSDQEEMNGMRLVWKCARALLRDGRYNESEELLVQMMEMSKRVLGDEHEDTLTIMSTIAVTYRNQGRWKKAQELATHVMTKRKVVLGPKHLATLESMANVALILRDLKRYRKAEKLGVQVLQTRIDLLGPEHPDTLTSMANLAVTYMDLQEWKKAEKLNKKVVEERIRWLGLHNGDTSISIGNQAQIYFHQGRKEEAEELFVQVIGTLKRTLGVEHPDTLGNMANLALIYDEKERREKAEELGMEVLGIRKKVLGDNHPHTLHSMGFLARVYWKRGRRNDTGALLMQMMELSRRSSDRIILSR